MNEAEFAYRIRQALDEGASQVDYTVSLRLEKARNAALDRSSASAAAPVWVPALQLAGAGGRSTERNGSALASWIFRFGMAAPLVALALGIVGIKQWQSDNLVAEVADLDFAVLLDDTPIDTYAHSGFGVYLRTEQASNAM
jgi:hypothetical protein